MTAITIVPHTHWDREWYAPFDEFRERLVEMMDTLLDLADQGFPHFHLDGQTAMIDDYLEVRPERAEDVERHAHAGRFSVGPWFTQMDEFLVSGESSIRNLERGLARAKAIGVGSPVGYLPDQFGHIGQMPQILRNAGLEHAVVWRGVPASIDRSAFRWESPDGSSVLAEYLAFGYFVGAGLRDAVTPQAMADALRDVVERLRTFSPRDRLLLTAGADHHGPDPSLPHRLAAATAEDPSIEAEVGSLAAFVEEPLEEEVPTWRGELRSSARAHLLPNVYSARVHQKRERGRMEALLERYAEPLAALVPGFGWPQDTFDRIWQLLLWNGAHDSACGCSHDQVAHDVDARFAEARSLTERIIDDALGALGGAVSSSGTLVFNVSTVERDRIPALGWRIAEPRPRTSPPITVGIDGDRVRVGDDVSLRLLDEPDVGDLYNFCPVEGAAPSPPERIERRAAGWLLATWPGLEVRLAIAPDGDLLRLGCLTLNERPDHRLRLHVELPEPVDQVIAGSPFELVQRPLVSEGSTLEAPSPTWPASGFVLAGDTAVLGEGVFEYEVVDGRALAITLLRCVGTISRQSIATRPSPAGPDVPTPAAQMLRLSEVVLGIVGTATPDDLLPAWERLALPPREARATGGGHLPDEGSLLDLDLAGAALSSVRRRDGRVEVRVWNPSTTEARELRFGSRRVALGPARIETIALSRSLPDGGTGRPRVRPAAPAPPSPTP